MNETAEMTTATITNRPPVKGPEYDKARPETRQSWLDFRAPGITATQIRDWGTASKRRKIIDEKISGEFEDLSHLPYVDHGNRREPIISEWVRGRFGITPTGATYAHPDNPRFLASPDGVTLHPFTGDLVFGTPDAAVLEIKTSKHDLTPGALDSSRTLIEVAAGSDFDRSNYYMQMQWQMFVMNAVKTLFVYEQHDDIVDPETGTFTPVGPPEYAWIMRDQALIDILVEKVAPKALAEIDAARVALKPSDLPPASTFPAEDAVLAQEVLQARDAESVAKSSKERAWKALQEKYVTGDATDDMSVDLGFATFTVSTSTPAPKTGTRLVTDEEAMRRRAPKMVAQYEALRARYTKEVPFTEEGEPTQRMTITAKKETK